MGGEDPCPSLANATSECLADVDGDGIVDNRDNCLFTQNPSQDDLDHDGVGDVFDPDAASLHRAASAAPYDFRHSRS